MSFVQQFAHYLTTTHGASLFQVALQHMVGVLRRFVRSNLLGVETTLTPPTRHACSPPSVRLHVLHGVPFHSSGGCSRSVSQQRPLFVQHRQCSQVKAASGVGCVTLQHAAAAMNADHPPQRRRPRLRVSRISAFISTHTLTTYHTCIGYS